MTEKNINNNEKFLFINTDNMNSVASNIEARDIDYIYTGSQGKSLSEKLAILGMAAKYDVSCSSSGVNRAGSSDSVGNAISCGICHSFTSDGRCVSLLKILMSNDCAYDCKYCINRRSNDVERASFSVDEIVALTMNFYKRNYIEGLFLSSAVYKSPDETMVLLCSVLYRLRFVEGFYGYIHCKAVPGADEKLIEFAGRLADRMSVNIEMPNEKSLMKVAPQKNKKAVLNPMRYLKDRIVEDREVRKGLPGKTNKNTFLPEINSLNAFDIMPKTYDSINKKRTFVPGGQSTQMIIGATSDKDVDILTLSEALYKKMNLKRVYYSAYIALNDDKDLPTVGTAPPLMREHRLYQADWLLRYYGFSASEIMNGSDGNLSHEYDPKCDWALRNLSLFPVEINKADYELLLRVPGIGVKSAGRIVTARKYRSLDFCDLKKLGIVMKRAQFFITCKGKSFGKLHVEPDFIKRSLMEADRDNLSSGYTKLSLFDMVV